MTTKVTSKPPKLTFRPKKRDLRIGGLVFELEPEDQVAARLGLTQGHIYYRASCQAPAQIVYLIYDPDELLARRWVARFGGVIERSGASAEEAVLKGLVATRSRALKNARLEARHLEALAREARKQVRALGIGSNGLI